MYSNAGPPTALIVYFRLRSVYPLYGGLENGFEILHSSSNTNYLFHSIAAFSNADPQFKAHSECLSVRKGQTEDSTDPKQTSFKISILVLAMYMDASMICIAISPFN